MSTISASTTTTTAYKVAADTTGTLVLQTGATPTTAVTIDGSQNVAFANAITPTQTGGIVGTTTNNNANAGSVGEYIASTVLQASRVALTSGTPVNVTSISLTAGDWDVTGLLGLSENSSVAWTYYVGSISSVSGTLSTLQTNSSTGSINTTTLAVVNAYLPLPVVRVSLASTTTYYLVAQGGFTGGSGQAAFGTIRARRVR